MTSNDWSDVFPAEWNDADAIEGADQVDKSTLIGKAFLVTNVAFVTNGRGIGMLYLTAEDVNGNRFVFTDSSTGIRAQVTEYLRKLGKDDIADTDGEAAVRLVAPNGLRVSEYDVQDKQTKKWKLAKTYYLTTRDPNAVKAAPAKAAPARKTTAPKAS